MATVMTMTTKKMGKMKPMIDNSASTDRKDRGGSASVGAGSINRVYNPPFEGESPRGMGKREMNRLMKNKMSVRGKKK